MAGYRDFQTGEVLTAANVNDFLMEQSVMTFADAAARDAALGTAVASGNALREGMVAYLNDTDEVIKYDGTDWSSVAPLGGLVKVYSAIKTDSFSASVGAGGSTSVTGLSIADVALSDSNHSFLITAWFGLVASNTQLGRCGIAVNDGSGLLTIGDSAGNRVRYTAGWQSVSGSDLASFATSMTIVHSPGDTTERTYSVRAVNGHSSTSTLFVNRTQRDTDTQVDNRSASGLIIQEIAV